jgi:hypothetical protein
MGTQTKTLHDTKTKELTESKIKTAKLVSSFQKSDWIECWKLIRHGMELALLRRFTSAQTAHIWRAAWEKKSEENTSNNYARMASRFNIVGRFFGESEESPNPEVRERAKAMYDRRFNKCNIDAVYTEIKGLDKKVMKHIANKEAKANQEKEESSESTIEESPQATSKNKGWTNPKVSGRGYDLDRDLMKQMKELYMGEPDKFFKMIARILIADVNPIPTKWKVWRKAAEMELK